MASEALVVQTVGELMGPDALRAAVNRLKAENAQNMQAAALIMEVVDPASYQNAVNAGRVLQTAQIKATTFFKPIKQEHDRQKQVVLDAERELVAEIEREKRRLAGLITGFEAEQARLRREEQQRHEAQMRKDEEERRLAEAIYLEDQGASREAIDEKLAEEPMPVAIVQPYVTPAKMAGKVGRSTWYAQVDDFKALVQAVAKGDVPIEVLEANMSALNKAAGAFRTGLHYPGVSVHEKKSTNFRGA